MTWPRTPGGWLVVPSGKHSGCQQPTHHGLCAFDGSEPDRCPVCHTTSHTTAEGHRIENAPKRRRKPRGGKNTTALD